MYTPIHARAAALAFLALPLTLAQNQNYWADDTLSNPTRYPTAYPTHYPTAYPTRTASKNLRTSGGTNQCRVTGVRDSFHSYLIGEVGVPTGDRGYCSGCGGRSGPCWSILLQSLPSYTQRRWMFCETDLNCSGSGFSGRWSVPGANGMATNSAFTDDDGGSAEVMRWHDPSISSKSSSDESSDDITGPWYEPDNLFKYAKKNWAVTIVCGIGFVVMMCLFCACGQKRRSDKTALRERRRARQSAARSNNGRRGPPLPAYTRQTNRGSRGSNVSSASSLSTHILSPRTIRDLEQMDRMNEIVAHATPTAPVWEIARISQAGGNGLSGAGRGSTISQGGGGVAGSRTGRLNSSRSGVAVPSVPVAMALVLRQSEELSAAVVPVAESVPIVGAVAVAASSSVPAATASAVVVV